MFVETISEFRDFLALHFCEILRKYQQPSYTTFLWSLVTMFWVTLLKNENGKGNNQYTYLQVKVINSNIVKS